MLNNTKSNYILQCILWTREHTFFYSIHEMLLFHFYLRIFTIFLKLLIILSVHNTKSTYSNTVHLMEEFHWNEKIRCEYNLNLVLSSCFFPDLPRVLTMHCRLALNSLNKIRRHQLNNLRGLSSVYITLITYTIPRTQIQIKVNITTFVAVANTYSISLELVGKSINRWWLTRNQLRKSFHFHFFFITSALLYLSLPFHFS